VPLANQYLTLPSLEAWKISYAFRTLIKEKVKTKSKTTKPKEAKTKKKKIKNITWFLESNSDTN